MIPCEKCGKPAMSKVNVIRYGKTPGAIYEYDRYVHYHADGRRKVKRTYCYVRIPILNL